ncbi:hypothetical protein SNEBB_005864 [Seison nebaliae]|nr:hypothetical protein SNEBB_005864 [Seison nebaliae]
MYKFLRNIPRLSYNIIVKQSNPPLVSRSISNGIVPLPLNLTIPNGQLEKLQKRNYSVIPAMTMDIVRQRVELVLKLCDKINVDELKLDAHFQKDLGLDSLDHVDVIVAMEDEFQFEIPDVDAETIWTPGDLVQYICDKLEIYE